MSERDCHNCRDLACSWRTKKAPGAPCAMWEPALSTDPRQDLRNRKYEAGLVPVHVWVHAVDALSVKAHAHNLNVQRGLATLATETA